MKMFKSRRGVASLEVAIILAFCVIAVAAYTFVALNMTDLTHPLATSNAAYLVGRSNDGKYIRVSIESNLPINSTIGIMEVGSVSWNITDRYVLSGYELNLIYRDYRVDPYKNYQVTIKNADGTMVERYSASPLWVWPPR